MSVVCVLLVFLDVKIEFLYILFFFKCTYLPENAAAAATKEQKMLYVQQNSRPSTLNEFHMCEINGKQKL